MLVVHGFAPVAPLASPSPFCLKLETWLRMAGIEYKARGDFSPMAAPSGKAPYVTLEDGSVVGDSQRIIELLSERADVTLDDGLSEEDKARTTLLRRTCDDSLYFVFLYERWVRDEGYAILHGCYFEKMPFLPKLFIPALARRGVIKAAHAQGTSRYTRPEILARASEDLDALAYILGDKPYFLGDEPRSIDATLYGFLANGLWGPFPGELQDDLASHQTLVAWCERVRDRYWG